MQHEHCATGFPIGLMKANISLKIDSDLLREARALAAEEGRLDIQQRHRLSFWDASSCTRRRMWERLPSLRKRYPTDTSTVRYAS